MSNSALCIVPDAPHARTIFDDLRAVGFRREDVSIVIPNRAGNPELLIGWLGGITLLTIPGMGSYQVSGPLLGNLHVYKNELVSAVSRTLAAIGLSAFESKLFENKLRGGQVLLAVLVNGAVETTRAIEVFERNHAEFSCVAKQANREAAS